MINWYGDKHICTAQKNISLSLFFFFFYPILSSFVLHVVASSDNNIWVHQGLKRKVQQSILFPRCCVNLLMWVYCKLCWCVPLVNCTDRVLVNTGFYFVFLAKNGHLVK